MERISPEMDIVCKNGSVARYAGSSLSSSPGYESQRQSPHSRTEDGQIDNMEALKLNNMRYQFHRRETLPTLMNKYIVQQAEMDAAKSRSPSAKVRKKKRQRTFNLDDDREREKRLLRETEKFLQIYDDLHKIRNYYYREYMVSLRKKVEQQRKDIKEKDEAKERERQQRIAELKLQSHKVKKRFERHNMIHDETFLQKIPKTEIFKIVQLQDKLKRQGTLKNNTDVDEFWTAIRKNPAVFNYYLEKLNMDPGSHSLVRRRLDSRQKSEEDQGGDSMSYPGTESFELPTGDDWAITQMYPAQHKKSMGGARRESINTTARQAANDLEKRYPRMEMPELFCFKMDLSKTSPEPNEMLQNAETQARDHERKKYMRQLHKMHQLAHAHQVAAQRILKKHEDELEMVFGGPDINDVIDVNFAVGQLRKTSLSRQKSGPSTLHSIEASRTGKTKGDDDRGSTPASYFSEDSSGRRSSVEATPLPLTMDKLLDSCQVMEAKCPSLYWSNYLKAGKSTVA